VDGESCPQNICNLHLKKQLRTGEEFQCLLGKKGNKSADKMRTLLAVQHPDVYNANQLALASMLLAIVAATSPRKELATQSTR